MLEAVQNLFTQIEDKYKAWELTNEDLQEFNKSWQLWLSVTSSNPNYNLEKLWETGKEYEKNALATAWNLEKMYFDRAKQKVDIESAASDEKIARSDETREEFLNETNKFRDRSDERYDTLDDITDEQRRIAAREANITEAKAWRYWDVYDEWQRANIKNDIIWKYATNILSAEQYELENKRELDKDLLNVGIKELEDKNMRDAFKDALLDKENSYIFDAIDKAQAWDEKAIKDVETFYQWFVKQKASEEDMRWMISERIQDRNKEFASYDLETKIAFLRDLTKWEKWATYLDKQYEQLVAKYPNATLDDLVAKVRKEWQYAMDESILTWTASQKLYDELSDREKESYDEALKRWRQTEERSDLNTETSRQIQANTIAWKSIYKEPVSDIRDPDNIDRTEDRLATDRNILSRTVRDDISWALNKVKTWWWKTDISRSDFYNLIKETTINDYNKYKSWDLSKEDYQAIAKKRSDALKKVYNVK